MAGFIKEDGAAQVLEFQPMKGALISVALLLASGLCAAAADKSPGYTPRALHIRFDDDGTKIPCKQLTLELAFEGRTFVLNGTGGKVWIPEHFAKLRAAEVPLEDLEADARLTCDGHSFNMTGIPVGWISPGYWTFGIDYPPFSNSAASYPELGKKKWFTYLVWDPSCEESTCKTCTCDGVFTYEGHDELPPAAVIAKLKHKRLTAKGVRARDAAYALAIFNEDYADNRGYILRLLKRCAANGMDEVDECDDVLLKESMDMYWRLDDEDVLQALLKIGDLPHDSVREWYGFHDLDDLYRALLMRDPDTLIRAWRERSPESQRNFCMWLKDSMWSLYPAAEEGFSHIRKSGDNSLIECISDAVKVDGHVKSN